MGLRDLSLRVIFKQSARDENRSVNGAAALAVFTLTGWERMVRAWDLYTSQTSMCWTLVPELLHIFPPACELHPPRDVQWGGWHVAPTCAVLSY